MIIRVRKQEQEQIKKIIKRWIENGCWDTRIYAGACLGAVFGLEVTSYKFTTIDDLLRAARAVGYTYEDELAEKVINKINEMEAFNDN